MENAVNKNAVACCSKRTAGDKREAGWIDSALVAKFEEKYFMAKSDYKKLGLPAVRVVDVKGYEFAKVGTIAKWLDVSADVVRDLLLRLGQGHEIRVLRR